jgi:multiple sugar transport system ATP-binding protein
MTLADRIVVMQGGRIPQQGSPKGLFEHPVNKFVAGFLGMPPMNFLAGEIVEEAGEVFVEGAAFRIRLDAEKAAAARVHSSRRLTLGIRPSDLKCDPDAGLDQSLRLAVEVSEYVGAQSVLLCRCGPERTTVEVNSETPLALGEALTFAVNPDRVHLFDRATEIAL